MPVYGTISRLGATLISFYVAALSLADAPDDRLHGAAGENDLAAVRVLIESGADVGLGDSERGGTPLHWATTHRDWGEEGGEALQADVVRALMDAGAELDVRDFDGRTPLHWAALGDGYPETVGLLVELGADVNARSDSNRTPLHLAAEEGWPPMVLALLKAGADPNAVSDDGRTPLHFMSSMSSSTVRLADGKDYSGPTSVLYLLAHGAAIDPPAHPDTPTPLMVAIEEDAGPALALLLDLGADPNYRGGKVLSPLHLAVNETNLEAARALLRAGADVHAEAGENSVTPLHQALFAYSRSAPMVRLLLDAGADIHARTGLGGFTPLHFAAHYFQEDIAELLLEAGANVDAHTDAGVTPIQLGIARAGDDALDVARVLLDHGAATDPPTLRTPLLDLAVHKGAEEVALVLLDRGVMIERDGDGGAAVLEHSEKHDLAHVAVRVARRGGLPLSDPELYLQASVMIDDVDQTARLLALRGEVDEDDERSDVALLRIAAEHDSAGVARLLLERGAVDVPADDLWLHLAAQGGSAEVARLLLDAGASLSTKVFDGRTPLHTAARSGALEVARLLLEHGADIDASDDFGWTPLHVALFGDTEGHPVETAMMLVEEGASVNAETLVMGWRPLHLAAWLRDPRMMGALLDRRADVNAPMRFGGWTPLNLALRQPEALVGGAEHWEWSADELAAKQAEAEEVIAMLRDAGGVDGGTGEPVRLVRYGRAEAEAEVIGPVQPRELAATWFYQRQVLRGAFTKAGADERLISMSVGLVAAIYDYGRLHALIDSAGATHFLWLADSGGFELTGTCRDSQSGRDHAIYRFSPDGSCCWEHNVYMYWDDDAGGLVEGFDDYWHPPSVAKPSEDGRCRWRAAKAQSDVSERVFGLLRAGVSAVWEEAEVPAVLGYDEIPQEVAEEQLALLRANSTATVVDVLAPESEEHSPEAGNADVAAESGPWEVIHVRVSGANDYIGDETGITLVHDRRSGGWRSILDCEYVDFHGLEQDTLYLSIPYECGRDEWRRHRIKLDLSSLKVDLVEDYEEWDRIIERHEVD